MVSLSVVHGLWACSLGYDITPFILHFWYYIYPWYYTLDITWLDITSFILHFWYYTVDNTPLILHHWYYSTSLITYPWYYIFDITPFILGTPLILHSWYYTQIWYYTLDIKPFILHGLISHPWYYTLDVTWLDITSFILHFHITLLLRAHHFTDNAFVLQFQKLWNQR